MKRLFAVVVTLVLSTCAVTAFCLNGGPPAGGGPPPAGGPPNGGPPPSNGGAPPAWIGTVLNLQSVSTGFTFTLQGDPQHSISVTTTSSTTITDTAGDTATLVNGLHVAAQGTFTASTQTLAATAVTLDGTVGGTVASLASTSTGSSFSITYAANQSMTVVTTSATTVKNASNGKTATLSNGQMVIATGSYSAATSTFTATSIEIDDRTPAWMGVVASLTTTSTGSTFSLEDGQGNTITVTTTSATTVTDISNGATATLADGQFVGVIGTYTSSTNTLAATEIGINDLMQNDETPYAEGVVASINSSAKTFTVKVGSTSISPAPSTTTVKVSSSTAYRAPNGKTITFSGLAVGMHVRVDGTYAASTKTLTAQNVNAGK